MINLSIPKQDNTESEILLEARTDEESCHFTLSEEFISYLTPRGKGLMPWDNVLCAILASLPGGTLVAFAFLREAGWNEERQKQHPILWKLRLIERASDSLWILGQISESEDLALLRQFLVGIDVAIFEGDLSGPRMNRIFENLDRSDCI